MKCFVFGCGFLGLPTAKGWRNAGNEVVGMTRSRARFEELEGMGIVPQEGNILEPASLQNLPRSIDVVLFAVGMDRSRYSDIHHVYVDGLKNVLDQLDQVGHFVYISSTGVYGNFDGQWVDEDSPTEPSREGGRACLDAENLLRSSRFGSSATILRCAGLYGHDRIPMQEAITNREWSRLTPTGHLNLIHVDDAAGLIHSVVEHAEHCLGETFLVSDGQPAERVDYYNTLASQIGTGPIPWHEVTPGSSARSDKKINNRKILNATHYKLQYPDFRAGLRRSFSGDSSTGS